MRPNALGGGGVREIMDTTERNKPINLNGLNGIVVFYGFNVGTDV